MPRLLALLNARKIRATWYVTLGPDNMGRHLARMLRPSFALKMWRSGAPSLYGWEILLRGTLWPGPQIGARLAETIRQPDRDGHEMGVHAWDHHRWQVGIDSLSDAQLEGELTRATETLATILGHMPRTAAAPGWRCTERVLALKSSRAFAFRSDCRGVAEPFLPLVHGASIDQPQVPVDLPTYDEGVGRASGADRAWNDALLHRMGDGKPHVLTIHAESEGGAKSELFAQFLDRASARGHQFEPLGSWLAKQPGALPCAISRGTITGREGWLCTRGAEARS